MNEFIEAESVYGRPVLVPAMDVTRIAAYSSASYPKYQTRIWAYDGAGNQTECFVAAAVADVVASLRSATVPMVLLSDRSGAVGLNAAVIAHVTSAGNSGGARILYVAPGGGAAQMDVTESPSEVVARATETLNAVGLDEQWVSIAADGQPASLVRASGVQYIAGPAAGRESAGFRMIADGRSLTAYAAVESVVDTWRASGAAVVEFGDQGGGTFFVDADCVTAVVAGNGSSTTLRLVAWGGSAQNVATITPVEEIVRRLVAARGGVVDLVGTAVARPKAPGRRLD